MMVLNVISALLPGKCFQVKGDSQEGPRIKGPEAVGGRAAASAAARLQELVVGQRRRAPDGRIDAGLLPTGIHQLLAQTSATE